MNPYYTRLFDVAPLTFARSGEVEAEFERIEQGFDGIAPFAAELAAARQGQVSLLLNLQRYINTFAPATASTDLGGFLVRNSGAPVLAGDLVNKAYADNLAFSAALPDQGAGSAGLPVVSDGGSASWGLPHFAHIALTQSGIF